jgi:hypothetical protein
MKFPAISANTVIFLALASINACKQALKNGIKAGYSPKVTISCEQMSSRPMSTKDFAALTGQAEYCPNNDFLPDLRSCEAERCSSGDVVHSITVL